MNAFTVDISSHLEDSPKFVKLGPTDEDVFQVDDRKNTVLKIQEILNHDQSAKSINKALELALGREAVKRIEDMELSITAFQNVFIGVMAAMNSKTFEETEKDFRNIR